MSTYKNNTHSNHGHSQPPPELATHTRQAIWRISPDKPAEQTANNLILKNPLGEIKEFLVRVRAGLSLSRLHPRPDQGKGHSHTQHQRHNRGRNRLVYPVLLMLVLLSLLLTSCSSSDILGDQSADQSQSASSQDSPKLTLEPTDFGGGDVGKTIRDVLITIATAPASFVGNLSLTSLDWLLHFSQSVRFDYPDGQRVCGTNSGGGAVSLQPLTQCATQVFDGMKFIPISLLLLAIFPFLLKYAIGGFLGGGGSLTDFFIKGIAVILFSINMDTIMTLLVSIPMRLFFYILSVNPGGSTATTSQAASGSNQQDAWIKQLTDSFSPLFKLDSSVHNNNLPFAWLVSILAIVMALAILAIGLAFLVRSFLLIFWFILSPLSLSSLLLEETSGFFYAWQGRVLAQVVSILPLAVVLRIAVVLEGAFPSFKNDVFSLLVLMASEAILLGISLVMAWRFLTGEMRQHLQLAGQGFGLARSLVSGSLGAAGGALGAARRAPAYVGGKIDAVGQALFGTETITAGASDRSSGLLGGLVPGGVTPWRTTIRSGLSGGSGLTPALAAGVATSAATSGAALESAGGAEVDYASSSSSAAPRYSWPEVGNSNGTSSEFNDLTKALNGMMSAAQLTALGGVNRIAPPPPPRPALSSASAGGGSNATPTARSNQTMLLSPRPNVGSNKAGQIKPEIGAVALTATEDVAVSNERQTHLLNDAVVYRGGGGFGANADAFYYGGSSGSGSVASSSGAGYYGGNGSGSGQAPVNSLAQAYSGSDAGEVGSDGGNSWDAATSLATLAANSQIIDPATGKRLDFGQVIPALAGINGVLSPAPNPSPVAANPSVAPVPVRPAITARSAQRLNGGQGADNGVTLSDPQLTPQLGSYSAPTQPFVSNSNSSSGISGLADNFGAVTPPVAPAATATPSSLTAPLPVVVPPPPPPPPLPQTQTQSQNQAQAQNQPVPHLEPTAAGGDVNSVAAPTAQPSTTTPSVGLAPVASGPIMPPPPLTTGTPTPPVSSGPARAKNVMSNGPDQLIQPLPLNIAGVSSGPVQPNSAAQPLPANSAGGISPIWPGGGTGPSSSSGDNLGGAANSFSISPAAGNGGMYEGLVNPGSSSATAPSAGFGAALPSIPPPPPMLSLTSPLPDAGAAPGSGAGVGLPPTVGQPQQQPGLGNVPPNNAGSQGSGQPGGTGMGS